MAHLIGISGAQGGGKTTLLNGLRDKGYLIDDFKVSRAVQAELGWTTLENATKDPKTMVEFQEAIFAQKLSHDLYADPDEPDGVMLVERTFADIYAYASHWAWELHYAGQWLLSDCSYWLQDYRARCIKAQRDTYSGVLLLPLMNGIPLDNDPHRAKRNSAEQVFETIERFTQNRDLITVPTYTIYSLALDQRVLQATTFLERFHG